MYHKKAPHCLTKNNNHIRALPFKNLYAYKAHNGSSFRRLGCSAIRAENFAEQSRSAAQIILRPLCKGKTTPYTFQSMAKEYRRHLHLYSCIVSYLFLFVNKMQTFVCIFVKILACSDILPISADQTIERAIEIIRQNPQT